MKSKKQNLFSNQADMFLQYDIKDQQILSIYP